MALFTKGISLWFKEAADPAVGKGITIPGGVTTEYWGAKLPGLQEVGELQAGASASSGYDKIEVTTLSDSKHMYIDGLMADEGEASSIDFTFLYDKDLYSAFLELAQLEADYDPTMSGAHKGTKYFVTIPHVSGSSSMAQADNSAFAIHGLTSAKVNAASVNGALTMTVTITPVEPIEFTA